MTPTENVQRIDVRRRTPRTWGSVHPHVGGEGAFTLLPTHMESFLVTSSALAPQHLPYVVEVCKSTRHPLLAPPQARDDYPSKEAKRQVRCLSLQASHFGALELLIRCHETFALTVNRSTP